MADSSIVGVIKDGKGTFKASGAIVKGQAVKPHTTEGEWIACAADGAAKGIADEAAASGAYFSVTLVGGTEALAGAALATPGTWLKSDTNGKLIAVTTDLDPVVGYSIGIATAENDMVPVFVIPQLYSA